METNILKNHNPSRSEEVQDIIERMPTTFGARVAFIIVGIFFILMLFGWLIRYPDIVTGNVVINTPLSPIKLIATSSGQLNLLGKKNQASIKKNQAVAIIENGTTYDTLLLVKSILQSYNLKNTGTEILGKLPAKVALGELTNKYYVFLSSLHQLYNFNTDRIYDKQLTSLQKLNAEQQKEMEIGKTGISIANENSRFIEKAYQRDSVLFYDKVTAAAEFEKSKQTLLSNRANKNNALNSYIAARKQAQQTQGQIVELSVQKQEKKRELELNIQAAYHDLMDNIKLWEQKYLLTAPFDGQVQFFKFWTDKQFVQAGDPVFTIVPVASQPYGQVVLPAFGAGKVKQGQEVVVKLNDYPYMEYGSIKGSVASISLTTNTEKTQTASVETYLVTIKFDKGLTTNYGQLLDFKHEATGSAEIITKDRRLLERLFDNLKYVIRK